MHMNIEINQITLAKTVAISDEVYDLLKKSRLPGESFSAAIKRILRKNKLSEIVGSGTISLQDWKDAKAHLLKAENTTAEKLMSRH
jgi:predicted CopG family antitoxin